MNDIETIAKQNADFAKQITTLQGQGRYVVAEYAGLHLIAIYDFALEDEAVRKFQALNACQAQGTSAVLYPARVSVEQSNLQHAVAANIEATFAADQAGQDNPGHCRTSTLPQPRQLAVTDGEGSDLG